MASANRTCHATGCTVAVTRGKLMCRDHWFALPQRLRLEINASWREGRIRDWSANCLEARRFLADVAASPARHPTVTPQHAYEMQARLLGERP